MCWLLSISCSINVDCWMGVVGIGRVQGVREWGEAGNAISSVALIWNRYSTLMLLLLLDMFHAVYTAEHIVRVRGLCCLSLHRGRDEITVKRERESERRTETLSVALIVCLAFDLPSSVIPICICAICNKAHTTTCFHLGFASLELRSLSSTILLLRDFCCEQFV